MTVDVGRLDDMVAAGVLQSVRSPVPESDIPAQYRHPDGLWCGLTTRARVIFAARTRIGEGEVASYEDLADPKMKGRVCIRSDKHPYNLSLIASMTAHKGERDAGRRACSRRTPAARFR